MTTGSHTLPFFRDHHSHPYLYAATRSSPDLRGITDQAAALECLSACQAPLNMALGWNDACYDIRGPVFDAMAPLVVFNASLHGLILNAGARHVMQEKYPELIAHLDDPVWMEAHTASLLDLIVRICPVTPASLTAFYTDLADQGIWIADEMSLSGEAELACFDEAKLAGRTRFWVDPDTFSGLPAHRRAQVQGIKLFTDGSLGARTAALQEPFSLDNRGVLNFSDLLLESRISQAYAWDKAVAIHAIGDRALEQVVSVLEMVRETGRAYPETRVEHAQFINRDQATRLRRMGCRLCMQPNFSTDSEIYADRLSPAAARKNNPFRMLIDDIGYVPGRDLIFGSDGMPHGVETAVHAALFPPYPGQVLSIDELVAGYGIGDASPGKVTVTVDEAARRVSVTATLYPGSIHGK
ncbi:MAG: hypothetical protein CSA22_04400 [Deltaproteobacteria bacterium]|nr:MAG: hypothetical protein CSA22_04400 [Deltaproteobacteria bacterium]